MSLAAPGGALPYIQYTLLRVNRPRHQRSDEYPLFCFIGHSLVMASFCVFLPHFESERIR